MPVVERNITYFFPTSKASRLEAIEQARANGQQWVSTSIVDGQERMKFCELSHTPSPHKPNIYVLPPEYPSPKGRIPYAGKE
jgi:hypothetical protein